MKKITFVLLLMSQFLMAQKDTIYLSPTISGTGTGDSWENATDQIGHVLENSIAGTQIWIKKGLFSTSVGYLVTDSLDIYGGFTGTESSIEARDLENNKTIFDGMNEAPHVLMGKDSLGYFYLDGLTIKNGNAKIFDIHTEEQYFKPHIGGGVLIICKEYSKLKIENCNFNDNYSYEYGAAVFILLNNNSALSVENSNFKNNNCEFPGSFYGSSVFCSPEFDKINGTIIELTNCKFEENNSCTLLISDTVVVANNSFVNNKISTKIVSFNCDIINNHWEKNDIGLFLTGTIPRYFKSCSFVDNGIGVNLLYGAENEKPFIIENSTFDNNTEQAIFYDKKYIYLQEPFLRKLYINNCIFKNHNKRTIETYCQKTVVNNCLFENNGGMSEYGGCVTNWMDTLFINNSIFIKNKSKNGLFFIASSQKVLRNNIFDNVNSDAFNQLDYRVWSKLTGGSYQLDSIYDGHLFIQNNLFFTDPLFDSTRIDNFTFCSPGINAGYNKVVEDYIINEDFLNRVRIIDDIIDIGPHEFEFALQKEDVSCQNARDGSIYPLWDYGYDITWEKNGQTGTKLEGLSSGTYHLSISDGDCALERTIEIHEPDHFGIKSKIGQDDGSNSGFVRIDSVFNGVAPYQLDWDTGHMGNEIIDLATGAYRLSVTDANGCLTTFEFFIEDVSAVSDYLSRSIQVSPNPVSDFVKLQVDGFEIDKIEIYDIQGTKIKVVTSSQSDFNKIDVSNLVNGTYFLRLKSGDLFGFKKMAILK